MKKKIDDGVKKLSGEQFWKWSSSIEAMHHAETRLKCMQLMLNNMERELEIQKLRSVIFKAQQVKSAEEGVQLKKQHYEELKVEFEKELGMSLNGCVIDEVTFEVKKID